MQLDYDKALRLLGTAKDSERGKPIANNTRLYIRGTAGAIAMRLHNTDVVTFLPGGTLYLNSGGWRTVTTKDRISYAVRISSINGMWALPDGSAFYDGMGVKNGKAIAPRPLPLNKKEALDREVRRYISDYAAQVASMPDPSGADCWICLGLTHGIGDVEHILSHIAARYYVPSLLLNAIREHGGNIPIHWDLCKRDSKHAALLLRSYFRRRKPAMLDYPQTIAEIRASTPAEDDVDGECRTDCEPGRHAPECAHS